MDKRYQVFVSSTFRDLQDERQEIMQALLELDCIPSGMELFPAGNDDQWTLIKRVIDDCDYYIVVIGGRYGSLGPAGLSYTEMEYRYAVEKGKPVMGFLHKDPGSLPASRCEESEAGRKMLHAFRELVQQKTVRYWTGPADLGSVVSRSLVNLIKTHPAVGWVKADLLPSESVVEELLFLRKRVEQLQEALQVARTEAPAGTDTLAQGDDQFTVSFTFDARSATSDWNTYTGTLTLSWNDIFSHVAPRLMEELDEFQLRLELDELVREESAEQLPKAKGFKGFRFRNIRMVDDDFKTIKVQFSALGLISKSQRSRSVRDSKTYWVLTPYGEQVMTRLRAIRRDPTPANPS